MRIFPARTFNKGFTLIELLITLGIIAFVIGMGIPRLGRSLGSQLRSTTGRLVTLNKELHHFARLKNRTYRLVIQFGDSLHKSKFFVESAEAKQLLAPPDATPPPSSIKDKDKAPPPVWTIDREALKKPVELPEGVQFEDVENDTKDKPITEGTAYIVFFPAGLVQHSVIHITDSKKIHWTLVINPLTAQTEIRTEYIKMKDLQ